MGKHLEIFLKNSFFTKVKFKWCSSAILCHLDLILRVALVQCAQTWSYPAARCRAIFLAPESQLDQCDRVNMRRLTFQREDKKHRVSSCSLKRNFSSMGHKNSRDHIKKMNKLDYIKGSALCSS